MSDDAEGADAEHWDPSPAERTYYREHRTGQLGWMVRRDGCDQIRLDRAAQELIVPMKGWEPEVNHKALAVGHLAQIKFEADRSLCRFIGLQAESRKAWVDLSDEERIAWMRKGPMKDPLRRKLYAAIQAALGEHAQ